MKTRHLLAGAAAAALLTTGACLAPATAATAAPAPHGDTAPSTAAAPQGAGGGLQRKAVEIPVSSLPAASRAALEKNLGTKLTAASTVWGYQIINIEYGKCLDADNSGPTAGQNGDKVQLWTCQDDNLSQYWVPWYGVNRFTELVNLAWIDPAMCLDADTTNYVNGAKVQLWHCYGDEQRHQNQWWSYHAVTDDTTTHYLQPIQVLWNSDHLSPKYLYANRSGATAGQNGDQVQIWQFLPPENAAHVAEGWDVPPVHP